MENKNSRSERARTVVVGAICGDIVGSRYERHPVKDFNFVPDLNLSRFTDDTVCSIAVADALVSGIPFGEALQNWCRKYPKAGYGRAFTGWIWADCPMPYGSFGNGSAMRVSAVGALASSVEECLEWARRSAEVTHNHPEGIKGAQAVALAIYLALEGEDKAAIKSELERRFQYDLSRNYSDVQARYSFNVSCQESVPEAIIAFLASDDYESAVRRAVALGGDADTQAAIAGSIAAAYYGVIPEWILSACMPKLPGEMMTILERVES